VAKRKQMILIPYWIQDTLKRTKMPLETCLDFIKLKPILSLNDLITFSTLQEYVQHVTGVSDVSTLVWTWSDSIPADQPAMSKYYWETITPMGKDLSFRAEIWARLFDKDSDKADGYAGRNEHPVPFAVYDLSPDVCGVVIYPGFFTDPVAPELRLAVVEAILKVLYVYNAPHEVASTPLFKRYLELLAGF